MKIVNAKWELTGRIPGATYTIKGTGPSAGTNQINIPPTVATFVGTDGIEINNVLATNAFEANKVRFYNTFDIAWQVSVNGGPYQSADTSSNPIYVCLVGTGATCFRTTVHLACSNQGATNADSAFDNTWSLINPANVNGWDEDAQAWTRKLYYYKAETTFLQNPFPEDWKLLQSPNDSAQCESWADLMYEACRLNGATPVKTKATPKRNERFLVKNWTFNASTHPNPNGPPPWWLFATAIAPVDPPGGDMVPVPPGSVYGDLKNEDGLKGQNSDFPPPPPTAPLSPSQKWFKYHVFLKYNGKYYDPSYGAEYTGPADFETQAIAAYGNFGYFLYGKEWYGIRKPIAGQVDVLFDH